ncbi:MAG: transposase [Nitrososphaerota archaeon]
MIINGIIYVITTGCKWEDMPIIYGSYKIAWRRLKKWQEKGIWDKIFNFLVSIKNPKAIATDSSTVEAKKGENARYDGFRKKKGKPLAIEICQVMKMILKCLYY